MIKMAKIFGKCKICGDIHFGDKFPEICPTCKVKDAYLEITKEEAINLMQ